MKRKATTEKEKDQQSSRQSSGNRGACVRLSTDSSTWIFLHWFQMINHSLTEIKQLLGVVVHYVCSKVQLPIQSAKILVPQLVNGTKEKNTIVSSHHVIHTLWCWFFYESGTNAGRWCYALGSILNFHYIVSAGEIELRIRSDCHARSKYSTGSRDSSWWCSSGRAFQWLLASFEDSSADWLIVFQMTGGHDEGKTPYLKELESVLEGGSRDVLMDVYQRFLIRTAQKHGGSPPTDDIDDTLLM